MGITTSLNDNFSMAMSYYKNLRKKNNKDIADALQLPPTTVSAWNTGRHLPDMGRLEKLAKYLDAPLEQFFKFSLENIPDKELTDLHDKIDTDAELVKFLKSYLQLSDENKKLLMALSINLK